MAVRNIWQVDGVSDTHAHTHTRKRLVIMLPYGARYELGLVYKRR